MHIYIDSCLYKKDCRLADNIYVKKKKNVENGDVSRVGYQTGEKSARFRFQLEAYHKSKHTEELWYKEPVCLWMTIYICFFPPLFLFLFLFLLFIVYFYFYFLNCISLFLVFNSFILSSQYEL